jgi:hypothetical protein
VAAFNSICESRIPPSVFEVDIGSFGDEILNRFVLSQRSRQMERRARVIIAW